MPLLVRPATDADARAISALVDDEGRDGWTRTGIETLLDSDHGLVLVAERDGALVGHVLATAVVDGGEILDLVVARAARRQGVARVILDALDEAWADRGLTTAWLEVREDNDGARALYAGAGWIEDGRRRGYYADGTDAVLMSRPITSPRS